MADDTIALAATIFGAIGPALTADEFHTGTSAGDSSDFIVYDSATGKMYYDADGNGAGTQIQFAALATTLTLSNADFTIV